jgi:hypothetical protein
MKPTNGPVFFLGTKICRRRLRVGKSRYRDGRNTSLYRTVLGLTDNHEQRVFEDKEGIQTISPGGESRTSFGMTPQLAIKQLFLRFYRIMYIKRPHRGIEPQCGCFFLSFRSSRPSRLSHRVWCCDRRRHLWRLLLA